MSSLRRIFSAAAACLCLGLASDAYAHPPIVTITAPSTAELPCDAVFPLSTDIDITIVAESADAISRTKNIDVKVNGVSLPGFPTGTPRVFDSPGSTCTAVMDPITDSCTVSGTTATLSVPWSIPGPGTYVIDVVAPWGAAIGTAQKTVTFTLPTNCCDKEPRCNMPAPPAIANAYINSEGYSVSKGVRGCIISQIAKNQAKDLKYGPRGGCYNVELIKSDVDKYLVECSKPAAKKKK